jgi:hypothetical protein
MQRLKEKGVKCFVSFWLVIDPTKLADGPNLDMKWQQHSTRHNTPIRNILSTAPQLSIS